MSFLVKYGLRSEPTADQKQQWLEKVRYYVQFGFSDEDAGRKAAKDIFPDCGTVQYNSQAQSIQTLLSLIDKND